MQALKKRSTTIHEDVRRMLGISRDGYAFCSYVHYRCADSRQKKSGWCCDNKQDVADFVGMTRRGLFKMAERYQEIGLIEISNSGDYRTTPRWIDAESKRELSSRKQDTKDGNLVPKRRELSSQKNGKNGNLVPNDTLYIVKEEEKEVEGDKAKKTTPTQEQLNALIDERETRLEAKKEKAPSIAGGFPKEQTYGDHMRTMASCQHPCSPSDFYPGGKCDKNGCYSESTHTVTTIEPNNPVTVVEGIAIEPGNPNATKVTITTSMNESGETYLVEHTERAHIPQNATTALFNRMGLAPKATNGDEADALIVEWAAENIETVKFKYNRAKRKFTPEDLDKLIVKFCGQYASNKDTGTMQRFLYDPARFFNDKLTSWLVDQPGFEKMAERISGTAKPETKYQQSSFKLRPMPTKD